MASPAASTCLRGREEKEREFLQKKKMKEKKTLQFAVGLQKRLERAFLYLGRFSYWQTELMLLQEHRQEHSH
jgi:hypothetical protein